MEYIRVTNENIEKEHICCAISNNNDIQVSSKKEWLKERFDDGLVFLKSEQRGKCFIEYIPAENAWNPIVADGYMYIDCLWVVGSFKSKKVKMPKPELYVIFTGNKGRKPDKISLSKEFFEGVDIDIEVKAKVIYESDTDDIINQYIIFCKVFNEQTKQHGMTQKAVTETIRICKNRNVLKEYLLDREKEVVTIMMSLFDDEQIMKSFIKSERHDTERAMAEQLIRKGKMTLEEIADCVSTLSFDELKEIETEIMQLA